MEHKVDKYREQVLNDRLRRLYDNVVSSINQPTNITKLNLRRSINGAFRLGKSKDKHE